MLIDLPECCSYAPDEEKGPYIYFVKGAKRVIFLACIRSINQALIFEKSILTDLTVIRLITLNATH